jgi:hypothetical protein
LPLFWWIKVREKIFGNKILISDCPYVNIAPCALPSLRRPWWNSEPSLQASSQIANDFGGKFKN